MKDLEKIFIEKYGREGLEPEDATKFALSEDFKQYWQQGMYSEEDLYEILNKFRKDFSLHRGITIMDFDIKNFIEQNKKK